MGSESHVRVAIVGATGYTGAELLRILAQHPRCRLVAAVGHAKAGELLTSVLPNAFGLPDGLLPERVESLDVSSLAPRVDAVFLALPHGKSSEIAAAFRGHGKSVFDLSADFRLRDRSLHEAWYEARTDALQTLAESAIYGLVEMNRSALRTADLVAVPGCFPTATSLPLIPLFRAGLVAPGAVIVDAKSGVSGAGRSLSLGTHYSETNESIRAYKIARSHRHTVEIEQTLASASEANVSVLFTPHLVPMLRGILATSYVRLKSGVDADACFRAAQDYYREDGGRFVKVLPCGECPSTAWSKGSNFAFVSYSFEPHTGYLIAQGAIDNLVKGASGQAVQCFNLRYGFAEDEGLTTLAIWP